VACAGTALETDNSNGNGFDWTSGTLEDFLGGTHAGVTPGQKIDTWCNNYEPGCPNPAGFIVYTADLGTDTLYGAASDGSGPQLSIGGNLPTDTIIVAFFTPPNGGTISTANSGALFAAGGRVPTVPEPASVLLFSTLLVGIARIVRKNLIA
jgi:hypothetical protein